MKLILILILSLSCLGVAQTPDKTTAVTTNKDGYVEYDNGSFLIRIKDGLEKLGKDPQEEKETPRSLEELLTVFAAMTNEATRAKVKADQLIPSEGVVIVFAQKAQPDNYIYAKNFSADSMGTGFIYKDYIVTNYHLCRGKDTIVKDKNGNYYTAKYLIHDSKQDICLMSKAEGLKNYKDFSTAKGPFNVFEEEKIKTFYSLDSKFYQELAEKDPVKGQKELEKLNQQISKHPRNYATVYSIFGDFTLSLIAVDNQKDEWTKKNGFVGRGELCKGGISGSAVVAPSGLLGIAWGAPKNSSSTGEDAEKRILSSLKPKALDYPPCFFIGKQEIEDIIAKHEKPVKK